MGSLQDALHGITSPTDHSRVRSHLTSISTHTRGSRNRRAGARRKSAVRGADPARAFQLEEELNTGTSSTGNGSIFEACSTREERAPHVGEEIAPPR